MSLQSVRPASLHYLPSGRHLFSKRMSFLQPANTSFSLYLNMSVPLHQGVHDTPVNSVKWKYSNYILLSTAGQAGLPN